MKRAGRARSSPRKITIHRVFFGWAVLGLRTLRYTHVYAPSSQPTCELDWLVLELEIPSVTGRVRRSRGGGLSLPFRRLAARASKTVTDPLCYKTPRAE